MQELSEHERLQRLLLYVRAHEPVRREQLQHALPECYAPYSGDPHDTVALNRHDSTTRRRLSRDRAKLAQLGFVLTLDDDDCYRLDEQATYCADGETGQFAALSEEQRCVIRQRASARLLDPDFLQKDLLRTALAKRCVELETPDLLPLVNQQTRIDAEPRGLHKVLKAIRSRKRLGFEYEDAEGCTSTRKVEPFGTYVHNHRCYVVCWDAHAAAQGDTRTFRLDRMKRLKVNAHAPETPDFDPRPFHVEEHYHLPFQLGVCNVDATVRFEASIAWKAPALTRHRGILERTSEQEDACALLWHIEVADVERLARWCIENGSGIVPTAPDGARDAYHRTLLLAQETCR